MPKTWPPVHENITMVAHPETYGIWKDFRWNRSKYCCCCYGNCYHNYRLFIFVLTYVTQLLNLSLTLTYCTETFLISNFYPIDLS